MLSTSFRPLGLLLTMLLTLILPAHAWWRMGCGGTLLEGRLDSIVSPGQVSGHTHVILGGNGFAPSMDYDSTQKSTCTSCSIKGDLSNYWSPKLYFHAQNGSFIEVPVIGRTVYYQQRSTYPGKKMVAFPPGFRMTAGNPSLRTYNSSSLAQQAISHVCLNYQGSTVPEAGPLPPVNCPNGIRSQVYFPSCWDGHSLDAPNHQDHMAYPSNYNGGQCPDSHPQPVISLFYEFMFDTGRFGDMWYGSKQPFVYAMGDDTGYGFHGDFFNGWDQATLQNGIDNFLDGSEGFNPFDVYSKNVFSPPAMPYGSDCSMPPLVNEQIHGWLPSLPGCNPVTDTPTTVANCPANNGKVLGPVYTDIYTDVTRLGWKYLGCGTDSNSRVLSGASTSADDMTVDTCIAFCAGKGFSMAGLEYSRECYCGNSIPAAASPAPGQLGGCGMRCSGNETEICGDSMRLSLYSKCEGGSCQNMQYNLVGDTSGKLGGSGSGQSNVVLAGAMQAHPSPSSSPQPSSTPSKKPSPTHSSTPKAAGLATAKVNAAGLATATASPKPTHPATTLKKVPTANVKVLVVTETVETTVTMHTTAIVWDPIRQGEEQAPIPKKDSEADESEDDDALRKRAIFGRDPVVTGTTAGVAPAKASPAPAAASPFPPYLPPGWTTFGCYSDHLHPHSLPKRVSCSGKLPGGQPVTATSCSNYCSSKGYLIAGLEGGDQCYCGNKISNSTHVGNEKCDLACKADPTGGVGEGQQRLGCGGRGSLAIYSQGEASQGEFCGRGMCDGPQPAPMVDRKVKRQEDKPVGKKTSKGNGVVARQKREAEPKFIGDIAPPKRKPYPPYLPAGWTTFGCYSVPVSPSSSSATTSLQGIPYGSGPLPEGSPMSAIGCSNYCSSYGFQIAGMVNGGCNCGDKLVGAKKVAAGQCNTVCKGDATGTRVEGQPVFYCGAKARMSVYAQGESWDLKGMGLA